MKNYKFSNALVISLIFLFSIGPAENKVVTKRIQNLQFILDMDGKKILSSIDAITSESADLSFSVQNKSFLGIGKKRHIDVPLNEINSVNPKLAALWNSTVMIFGAAADGVGIGTGFAIKKTRDGQMVFMTNLHVVEKFCNIPQDIVSDQDIANAQKYPCEALFVLHDVAINTKTDSASVDGVHPWKSEVLSIDYFDKQRDLVAFRISTPDDSDVAPTTIESSYDLKNLFILQKDAEKIDRNLLPDIVDGIKKFPITAFTLYLAAYRTPTPEEQSNPDLALIKKQWFKGSTEGIQTFENDKRLGFISALKHNIEVLPGSSGGPLALSDGRIIGINTCVEIKQFYARHGILWWRKQRLETYKSYFAMPTTFVNDFFDKLN